MRGRQGKGGDRERGRVRDRDNRKGEKMEMMLTHLITDQANECKVLTLDIGLGKDTSSMYLHRLIANQVHAEI